jgi:hypothetical protein
MVESKKLENYAKCLIMTNIIIFFQQLPRGPTNFLNKNLSGFIYAQQVQAGTTKLGAYFLVFG